MTEPKARRLVVLSGDGKGPSRYYVGGGRITAESLAWLYEKLTGRRPTPEEIEQSRKRLAEAYRNLNAKKNGSSSDHRNE
jgi:hypothetical protein